MGDPTCVAIRQAIGVSQTVRELLDQGPVAAVRKLDPTGTMKVDPEATLDALYKSRSGVSSVKDVVDQLKQIEAIPGQRGAARSTLATSAETQQLDALHRSLEDSVRASFREAADKSGQDPIKAASWLREQEPKIKELTTVATQFETVGTNLQRALEQRRALETSALAKHMQTKDPQIAINSIITDPANPAMKVREVLTTRLTPGGRRLADDPQALEGFKAGMVDNLVRRTNGDPGRMYNLITEPKVRNAYVAAMGEEQVARMTKLIDTASRVQTGEIKVGNPAARRVVSLLATVVGSKGGTALGFLTGGAGTLAGQAAGARAMREFVNARIQSLDPTELLTRALIDPNAEKFLLGKVPETSSEMRKATNAMVRWMRAEEGFRQQMVSQMGSYTSEDRQRERPLQATSGGPMLNAGISMDIKPNPSLNYQELSGIMKVTQKANPGRFAAAMDRYPDTNPNIEDRRTSDKTLGGYRNLVNSLDKEGYTQFPALRMFMMRPDSADAKALGYKPKGKQK